MTLDNRLDIERSTCMLEISLAFRKNRMHVGNTTRVILDITWSIACMLEIPLACLTLADRLHVGNTACTMLADRLRVIV